MPPKKEKERNDDNYWRLSIEESPINESAWKVKVIVIETAGSDQEIMYLNRFETYAKEEKRFVIKNICKSETMFMINQLGAEKKVKDENMRVFEEGHLFLKEKKDIPTDILALIIKHLILKMKEEYISIQRQKLVVREGMRNESLTMIDPAEIKNNMPQSAQPVDFTVPSQTNPKDKKGEGDITKESAHSDDGKKYSTLLRLRGEEWRDKVYVDDYPLEGPNLYLAITGFLEPYLLESLMKIGVPLTAIVQIRIDFAYNNISSGYFTGTKRGHSESELATEKSYIFWETLQQLRLNNTSADMYKDIAFIVFNPPYLSNEALTSSAENIYDELSYLMYDIQDVTRQHYHYLENMDVKCIPIESENGHLLNNYYNFIDKIPLECITPFSIVESMLQAICVAILVDNKSSTISLSTALTFIQSSDSTKSHDNLDKADNLINNVFEKLSKGDLNNKNYRVTCREEYDNYKDPVIINYGDCAKCATFHIENLNLDGIIGRSLVNMPICNLWKNQMSPTEKLQTKINFHISALLKCFDRKDLDDRLLNRLIHLLSFRKLYNNRSSLKKATVPPTTISEFKKIYLKRSTFAEPLLKINSLFFTSSATSPPSPTIVQSDTGSQNFMGKSDSEIEQVEYLFDCPDISELVSMVEIMNDKPQNHLIDNYDFFDDFTGINALQVLLDAFNKFSCLNYKYCEVTDSFIMMFYNNLDKDGITREEWRCHLPTPVCLQDFFDFILEEQFQWIQDEEKLYDERTAIKTKLEWKESLDPVSVKTCIENIDELESEFLIKGSLKYQERIQIEDINEEEDQSDLLPKDISWISTESDGKSSRKTKSTAAGKTKAKDAIADFNTDDISDNNQYINRFSAYNLGDRRVEVFGKDSIYFSKDGTKVYSYYTIILPMNLENLVLNITTGNGNNEFWIRKRLGGSNPSEMNNGCESFRINSKDQVMFYLKKNWYQMPISLVASALLDKSKTKERSKDKLRRLSSMNTQPVDSKLFHSFFITWPNGLIIESVHENNSPVVHHIKQFFVNSASQHDEDMRCITINGEVVIFKKSGVTEVFRPDGTYVKINKCAKRLLYPEVFEDTRSNTGSDKSKKGKIKNKSRDKLGRSTSKVSKHELDEVDMMAKKPSYYELFLEEFEIIDCNGVKETWINNKLICCENLLIRTATDYYLQEVFSRRMDGTNMLINKDGILVVTFHDNTRIITTCVEDEEEVYPDLIESKDDITKSSMFGLHKTLKASLSEKSEATSYTGNSSASNMSNEEEKKEISRTDGFVSVQVTYTIEHAKFATVTINKSNGKILVESPNNTSLTVDTANNFDFFFDKSTFANFDGDHLNINFGACEQCQSSTKCTVKTNHTETSSNSANQAWLTMKDSFGKNIVVDNEGTINLVDEMYKEEREQNREEKNSDKVSESCVMLQSKCKEMYDAKMLRFFVFHRDLTCSELVHRLLIEQYKSHCRWQPWCSINQYETFGDHRSILSILTPIHLTETDKWLMQSKFSDKPKQLKFKDLKIDTCKGFYHWMRPYDRYKPKPTKVDNLEVPRLPRAYVLRTLEQLWNEGTRENLKGGKELVKAVLRYRRMMLSERQTILTVPIKDPRSEEERRTEKILQDIAHRIYEDLRNEIADDIQSRARPAITTEAKTRQQSLFRKTEKVKCEELKKAWMYKQEVHVREVEEAIKPNQNLLRYWRRRGEEAKEEQFYSQLLREESIPPYFRNMLGGAAWLDVNQMAGEAVTNAELDTCECVQPSPSRNSAEPASQ